MPAFTSSEPRPRLLLASVSPRRAQLLNSIGVPFEIAPSSYREPQPTPDDARAPAAYVERLARGKAQGCQLDLKRAHPPQADILVLAADTIVCYNGEILTKPKDEEHARATLKKLQGQTHQVYTGVCLKRIVPNGRDETRVEHETTRVKFRPATDEWISRYVETGEPMDKAGAYAAQGQGSLLIERMEGDYFNVVGLPLCRLGRMLEAFGAPVEKFWT